MISSHQFTYRRCVVVSQLINRSLMRDEDTDIDQLSPVTRAISKAMKSRPDLAEQIAKLGFDDEEQSSDIDESMINPDDLDDTGEDNLDGDDFEAHEDPDEHGHDRNWGDYDSDEVDVVAEKAKLSKARGKGKGKGGKDKKQQQAKYIKKKGK